MDTLLAARLQMTFSLAFHMIFAALGVGMPLMMALAEYQWIRRKDETYLIIAKRWSKAVGVLFAIGAASGTVLSIELGLLWPSFMAVAGGAIGPAFTLEAFAFFIEAIFLGLYLYGWQRLSPKGHLAAGIMVAIGGAASSVLVTAANAWMQNPLGFAEYIARSETINPAANLFANPYWPLMALHSTLACYAATAFTVAGIYAWGILKGRTDNAHYAALRLALVVGLISSAVMPITGHASALVTAKYQPVKLAAMEAHFTTEKGAPLRIGGIPDVNTKTLRYAISIPKGLSILAYGKPDAEVAGLDQTPREYWPNVALTHYAFQVMVGVGMLMLLVTIWFWLAWRQSRQGVMSNKTLLRSVVAAAPFGIIALETGWIVTEVGRQPWIIFGQTLVRDAVTPNSGVAVTFATVVAIYLVLGTSLVWLLRRFSRNGDVGVYTDQDDITTKTA